MDTKLKNILVGAVAAIAVVVACFVGFRTLHSGSSQDGVADSAKEILSHSNNTDVLSDSQKESLVAHNMGPGSKKVKR